MVTIEAFRQIVMSFPEVVEQPHFEKTSFRVRKKIFATLDIKNNQACIKLSLTDQDVFTVFDPSIIFPVPNKWGQQGWTMINLQAVREDMLADAIKAAWYTVAPASLASHLINDPG